MQPKEVAYNQHVETKNLLRPTLRFQSEGYSSPEVFSNEKSELQDSIAIGKGNLQLRMANKSTILKCKDNSLA
jgi:DUF4097 and DUF4098 domain-containing protein YvlB